MSPGQKWADFEKEYLPSEWSSGTNILMSDVEGGDLSAHKIIIYIIIYILTKLLTAKNVS